MPSRFWAGSAAAAALFAFSAFAEAQNPPPVRSLAPIVKREQARPDIPAAHMPPPGMCRVWLDNVPAGQQPAPTDCASAIRNKPQNARVIFSDDDSRQKRNGKDGGRDSRNAKDSKPKKPDPTGSR